MSVLTIPTAEVFEPLLHPNRFKGAWGGRGSGKSHFFGGLMVEDAVRFPGEAGEGLKGVCIREIQKTLKHSAKSLIEAKLRDFGLGEKDGFKVFNDCIQTPGDGIIIFQGMQDHTADSIKSLEGFHRAWGEESQTLSSTSLKLLIPTIRWEDAVRGLESELWFSWNPRRKIDPIDIRLRQQESIDGIVVRANWSDNPWFPEVLNRERLSCLENDPDQYDHIWEGGYVTVMDGAYYARRIAEAKKDDRIGKRVTPDPLMTVRLFADIGGTGAKADNFVFWAAQFVGRLIVCINYYESQGQPIGHHLHWLHSQGYKPDRAQIWLPHDGKQGDKVYAVSYESAFREAGYDVTVVENQGKGAAMQRIEAGRRRFPQIFFDTKCQTGLDALGWYHEKIDEERNVGLGPDHDWSSHPSDAFGLMCICYEDPEVDEWEDRPEPEQGRSAVGGY